MYVPVLKELQTCTRSYPVGIRTAWVWSIVLTDVVSSLEIVRNYKAPWCWCNNGTHEYLVLNKWGIERILWSNLKLIFPGTKDLKQNETQIRITLEIQTSLKCGGGRWRMVLKCVSFNTARTWMHTLHVLDYIYATGGAGYASILQTPGSITRRQWFINMCNDEIIVLVGHNAEQLPIRPVTILIFAHCPLHCFTEISF